MINSNDVVYGLLISSDEVQSALGTALNLICSMQDRADLHSRSTLERFIDVAMGEIAELSVIEYLNNQGIHACSSVDKMSGRPDCGYDILIEERFTCSVKSSLSVFKSDMSDILSMFKFATKRSEVVDINIQVYFWLGIFSDPRTSVPSEENMAIVGWMGAKDLYGADYESYMGECREAASLELYQARPMDTLKNAIDTKIRLLQEQEELENEDMEYDEYEYGYEYDVSEQDEEDIGL